MFKFNFSLHGFSEQKSRIKAGDFDGKCRRGFTILMENGGES